MSQLKATPGPWSVIRDNDAPLDISVDGSDADSDQVVSQWLVVESETHAGFAAAVIDMNYPNSFDDDTLNANAALIAAAPDLYAALEALLDRYTGLVNCGDCGSWDCEKEDEVIAARAALAKATPVSDLLEGGQ